MPRVLLLLVALLPALVAAHASGASEGARAASAFLRGGQTVRALQAARRCLAADPSDLSCSRARVRAAENLGLCEVALSGAEGLRRAGVWDGPLAFSEAMCHLRQGDLASAGVALDEAAQMRPDRAVLHVQRAVWAARRGDADALADRTEQAARLGATPSDLELLALYADDLADDPTLDARLEALRHRLGDRTLAVHRHLVACERALTVGAVEAAEALAMEVMRISGVHERLRACRAEAARRQGRAAEVLEMTRRSFDRGRATPYLDAVRARALADLGQAEAAEALLDDHRTTWPAPVLASRAYVAYLRGDEQAAATWMQAAEAMSGRPEGDPRAWVPWQEAR